MAFSALPIWSTIPFVGMLLSIALLPLFKEEWWEKHQLAVSLFWSACFLIPFVAAYGPELAGEHLLEVIVLDYIPFITLLWGLYAVAGGMHVSGTFTGTTASNVALLGVGTALASWVGTTGAALIMIRPVLRANHWRAHKVHIVVFFIILVANMGGCLTPLGDPPLFLGFLRGVPFFWTMANIWPLLLINTAIILAMFVVVDRRYLKKEGAEGEAAFELKQKVAGRIPVRIEGWQNLFLLLLIIAAVILSGVIPQTERFLDPQGRVVGVDIAGIHLGFQYFLQIALIALAAGLSFIFTPRSSVGRSDFTWEPIQEVARLFLGIFVTMIPALILLGEYGGSLGLDTPLELFWSTGALSGFLDNSPTYVVFLTCAGALGSADPAAVLTTAGAVDSARLLAVSAGAVFFGAMTYIGNAPNFMVRSISEKRGIKMPSFFGYMGWSLAILLPVFVVDSLVFFM